MEESVTVDSPPVPPAAPTRFKVPGAIRFSHFLNDMMQSLIVAIYPLLKGGFHSGFVQGRRGSRIEAESLDARKSSWASVNTAWRSWS